MPDELHIKQLLAVKQRRGESLSADSLRLWAPAKINLNLLVGPVRPDGFHPLDSIVAKIGLYDRIDLTLRTDGEVTLACDGGNCGADEQNLAVRAARLIGHGHDAPGVDIDLAKIVRVGRGLGGGSSDAASVLAGLNQLWQLNLPDEQLRSMGAELGSDVPLFLGGPAVRMTGRGEILEPIEIHPFVAILINPDFGCSTRDVYAAFDESPQQMGEQIPPEILTEPPSQWRGRLTNQLAGPAEHVSPELAEIRNLLPPRLLAPRLLPPSLLEVDRELSCLLSARVHLTGSGSAMFILCDDEAEAREILSEIPTKLHPLCQLVQSNPW